MANKKLKPEQLLAELRHFTGTTQWYRNPIFANCLYTDGVKFLADNAGAYWLIDYIFSHQMTPKIKAEAFQVWKISMEENMATISVEDGDKNVIKKFDPIYSDFPLREFTLWFTEGVLLLRTEY